MTKEEGTEYWRPAGRKVLFLVPHPAKPEWAHPGPFDYWLHCKLAQSIALADLLGIPYPAPEWYEKIELTPDLRSTLLALSGPHCQTFVKAIQARRNNDTFQSGEDIQATG
jgi:hypothetical protein